MKLCAAGRIAGAALLGFVAVLPARAEPTVWQRARDPIQADEQDILSATERVLNGNGDERDMLRARAALVALSRGTLRSPPLVLLLIRFRRELGLSPARNTEELLERLRGRRLAPLLESEVYLEWAYLRLSEERFEDADRRLTMALSLAWDQEMRARLLSLRAWQRIAHGQLSAAQTDFELAVRMSGPRRTQVQILTGLALSFALLGYEAPLDTWSAEAFRAQVSRASVSGAGVFWDLALEESVRQAARLILEWGRAEDFRGSDPERADSLQFDICQELEDPELFGTSVRLRELWAKRCSVLARRLAPDHADAPDKGEGKEGASD